MDTEKEKDPRRLSRIHWLVGRESERGPWKRIIIKATRQLFQKVLIQWTDAKPTQPCETNENLSHNNMCVK